MSRSILVDLCRACFIKYGWVGLESFVSSLSHISGLRLELIDFDLVFLNASLKIIRYQFFYAGTAI